MKSIEKGERTPLMQLVIEIRKAAYDKCFKEWKETEKAKNNSVLDQRLQNLLHTKYRLEKRNLRVESVFYKCFVNQQREVRFDEENALLSNFIILCSYLAGRNKISEWTGMEILITLLNEIKVNTDYKFDIPNMEAVINQWTVSGPVFSHYFYFHYSLGKDQPQVAILKIDTQWKIADLKFMSADDRSAFEGTVSTAKKDKTVFVQLTDKDTGYGAFLSMTPTENLDLRYVNKFEGYYCSAHAKDSGNPVAGKFFAVKVAKEDVEDADKMEMERVEYSSLLYNQRLMHMKDSIKPDLFKDFVGAYEGYWFRTKKGIPNFVKIALKIDPDGAVIFKEDKMKYMPEGHIHQTGDTFLRCSFDNVDDHNYRLMMIFQLKRDSLDIIDGVYCGQTITDKIIAGRIRLYRSKENWEYISSFFIPTDNPANLIDEAKAEDLKKFFFGAKENSQGDDFIQPDLESYNKYINPTFSAESATLVKEYAGDYTMYKLDADKARVNTYDVNITINGQFSYTMQQQDTITKYSGTAYYAEYNCLVLLVKQKNNLPHYATYIFWVGNKIRAEIKTLSGVYSTISGAAPACGRAILSTKTNATAAKPYYKNSDEFFDADDDTAKILNFLYIEENNLIKTPREINSNGRSVKYGNLFFLYACDDKTDNRRMYLQRALENGFRDTSRIVEECKNGKFKDLEIVLKEDGGYLIVEFENGDKYYNYKLPMNDKLLP